MTSVSANLVSVAPWPERLHQLNLRATPARLAILAILEQSTRPLTIQAIARQLGSTPHDQATLYRTLNTLKKHGLVRHIDWQHGHAHFELTSLGDHHHVVCTKCQSVADVSCSTTAKMLRAALHESGFAAINEHAIEFFGLCQTCQR